MFDDSGNYDSLNRVLWNRHKVEKKCWKLKVQMDTILDIATGTGDLAILMTRLMPQKL
jgi:demethylmenaquinone methyltransferase/2-methoxy-6-polyprenyl-1,4-benzoquinol methylase